MKKLHSLIWIFIVLFSIQSGFSQTQNKSEIEGFNCYTIMVGKEASDDGSVLFAHIEDDFGKQLVNWYIKKAEVYHEGEQIELKNGGLFAQVEKTAKMLWLEIPGMDFSDSYLNEYGVCIASNSCSSREKDPDITDGGISYRLRGLMAERATTAREAVIIGGALVEQFGYTGSGRTYSIVDANEAWALSVVRGKHWVAQRIPDNQVMVLPNNYTIQEIILEDDENFLACPDLIDYAIKKEWYDPSTDGSFNFRKAYAAENSITHPGNTSRAWGAYHKFDMPFAQDDIFPFSFIPKEKISKEKLMDIFAYHYEGTELDISENYTLGSPYEMNGSMICGKATVYGFVTECRNWLPVDIGTVMWLAPQWPDIQPFIPWYCGISKIPDGFAKQGYLNDLSDHYNPPEDIHDHYDGHAFWSFVELSSWVNEDYGKRITKLRKQKLRLEKKLLKKQPKFEKIALKKYSKDPASANEMLNNITSGLATYSWKMSNKNKR